MQRFWVPRPWLAGFGSLNLVGLWSYRVRSARRVLLSGVVGNPALAAAHFTSGSPTTVSAIATVSDGFA